MNSSLLSPQSFTVGAGPIFRQMADHIDLVNTVNHLVDWDAAQCRVSPGERILVLVLDLLMGKSPLYRLAERWTATDVAVLIGAGRQAADFSDDSLGRALDKLAAEPAKVFSTVTLAAYQAETIDWSTIHWDSTSCSVYGNYADAVSSGVSPRYGYSKDRRPDLKQILLTLLVNREGVPRMGSVASGNISDKTLNGDMIDTLTASFAPAELHKLIYVADSALVTGPNLQRLAAQELSFISRCPETFRGAKVAKMAAWDREIHKEQAALDAMIETKRAIRFAYEADAQQALRQWQRDWTAQWHSLTFTVYEETHHTRPGRPRKHPNPEDIRTQWRIKITRGVADIARRQQELDRRNTFVLITTVPASRLSAQELLAEYKGQTHVERHFHFLKDPLFVDALFVKKPERIEALGYVLLMACLLHSLIERRLRHAHHPIPSPSRRVLTRPTGHEVVRHLEPL